MHRHLRLVGLRPAALPVVGGVPSVARVREHDLADDRAQVLADVALLRCLDDAERAQLANSLRVHAFADGAWVVRAGDTGDSMFVVVEGVLDVRLGVVGGDRRVNVLGPGSVLGERALFTGEPRSASVKALSPVVLYEIARTDLLPLLAQRPSMVDELSQAVAQYQARDHRTMEQALSEDAAAPAPPGVVQQLAARIRGWMASGLGSPRA
jgi:CRP-like cAMP-binding protein